MQYKLINISQDPPSTLSYLKFISSKVSLTDSDAGTQYNHYDEDARIHRPLRLKKKFYEFYTAVNLNNFNRKQI